MVIEPDINISIHTVVRKGRDDLFLPAGGALRCPSSAEYLKRTVIVTKNVY